MGKFVLGGGVSGLSAAYYLTKRFPKESVDIIEKTNRLGGWIKSAKQDSGVVYEIGPRTIRPRGPAGFNTLKLVEELGLENQILSIPWYHPAAQNRMIYVNGKLHSLPSSLFSIFQKKSPFSKPLIAYLLNDVITRRKFVKDNDESIYNFVERRFGRELAEYAISPLICGICAGNAKEISVKFLMESLFEKEQKYGSITNGILCSLFNRKTMDKTEQQSNLVKKAQQEKWSVYTFKDGIETLPVTLQQSITKAGVNINFNTVCTKIELNRNVVLHTNSGKKESDHLISCIPAKMLGNLIRDQHPILTELLENIKCVTVGVVNIEYKEKVLSREGFGLLVPPSENLPVLGIIFDSCVTNSASTLLTVMLGGFWFKKYFGEQPSEQQILQAALDQVANILNINATPAAYKISILNDCIPQYVVGHNTNVKKICDYIKSKNLPISLCGSSYNGVGLNDVILQSKNVVDRL